MNSNIRKEADLLLRWERMALLERETFQAGFRRIAGVDEAGRGPLAGPVVAAVVIFPENFKLPGLNDSKQLTSAQRELYYHEILKAALAIGVGIVESEIIDEINILQATLLAVKIAVSNMKLVPDFFLIDALELPSLHIPQKSIIKGDTLSYSIAGASVVAKVTRDRLMTLYHHQYPNYNFIRHKGYGTREHMAVLSQRGATPIHRKTFKGVLSPHKASHLFKD